jgi:putative ABC transport system substrate-binding protein
VDRVRNRRSFLIAIGVGALVRGVPSAAQQRRRVARLGWLSVLAPPDSDLDALAVFLDQLTARHSKVITDFALRERLPSIYGWSTFTEAGGLVSYGPNLREQYRRLATFADKVMRGVDAGSIPVELPRTFELQVNLATAKAIGVTIPQAVLQRADRIIE